MYLVSLFAQAAASVPDHVVQLEGISAGVIWAGIGSMLTIISLLGAIAYQAGLARAQLTQLIPKVNETHASVMNHSKECDTDRALTKQELEAYNKRLGSLERGGA